MLSELTESEANAILKSNGTLCLITDRVHPQFYVHTLKVIIESQLSWIIERPLNMPDHYRKTPKIEATTSAFFRLAFPHILVSHAYLK